MQDERNLAAWRQQWAIGRYLLLGTVIATAVNILLMLVNAGFYIPFCGSIPYYLTFFGYYFDHNQLGIYTLTGLLMALPFLAAFLLMWFRAKHSVGWMIAGMVLLIVDTVALALIALVLSGSPGSFLMEVLFHIVVLYELFVGIRARRRMDAAEKETPVFPEEWDSQTPADSQYTDTL